MVKPEWGAKRVCLSCGARFYDLQRDPIVCPACGTPFDPAVQSRPRRARAAPKIAAVAAEETDLELPAIEDDEADLEVEDEEEEEKVAVAADDADDEAEDDSDSAIEDVSELGNDDMEDVIDTELDEDEGER